MIRTHQPSGRYLVATLATLLAGAAVSCAFDSNDPLGPAASPDQQLSAAEDDGQRRFLAHAGNPIAGILHHADALELTADQVGRLEAIQARYLEAAEPIMEELRSQMPTGTRLRTIRFDGRASDAAELRRARTLAAVRSSHGGPAAIRMRVHDRQELSAEDRRELTRRVLVTRTGGNEANGRIVIRSATPEQREAPRQRLHDRRGAFEAARQEMLQRREALRPLRQQIAEARQTALESARAVLTPDQQERLATLRQERMRETDGGRQSGEERRERREAVREQRSEARERGNERSAEMRARMEAIRPVMEQLRENRVAARSEVHAVLTEEQRERQASIQRERR